MHKVYAEPTEPPYNSPVRRDHPDYEPDHLVIQARVNEAMDRAVRRALGEYEYVEVLGAISVWKKDDHLLVFVTMQVAPRH